MRHRPPGLSFAFAALLALPGLAGAIPLAWITNSGSNNLNLIDTANDSGVGSPIGLGLTPVGVAVAAGKVYVANDSGQLSVIDKASHNVSTPLNLGPGLFGVAVNPAGTRVYVSNATTDMVFVINTANNTQVASIPLPQPRGIAVSPDGSRVYIACNAQSNPRLAVLDGAHDSLLPNTVGLPSGPYGVAVSANGQRVYVSNEDAGTVSVVDAVNTMKLTDIFLGGQNPRGIVTNRTGTRAYVALYGNGQVATIDTTTNTSLGTVPSGGNAPWGIDVSADGSRVYVANSGSNNVGVIDTASNTVTGTIFVGQQPAAFGRFIEEPPPQPQVPPVLNDVPDQSGTVGTPFSLALSGYVAPTNGDAILSYAITSGTLPAGLGLDATSGVISGAPQLAGTGYSIAVTASDKDGPSNADTIHFSITTPGSLPPSDILVGSFNGSIRGFAAGASGNAAPTRVIAGATAQLQYPYAVVYEPKEDVLYVGDFYGQSVRVFPVGANGDATPRRVLSSVYLGQVKTLAVDTQHDELVVAGSGCILCTWSRTASGSDGPVRRLYWGGNSSTQINNPFGLALDPAHDLMVVGDSDFTSPYAGKVLVFPRTATGDVAPQRVLQGPATRIGPNTAYLAFDPAMQLLYVLTSSIDPVDSSLRHARILVFPASAEGDMAPLRSIEGPATQLDIPSDRYTYGLSLDPDSQRLLVSLYSNTAANNRVLAFFAGDSGNVAPLVSLGGASTGFDKIGRAVSVPDRILRNGFETP